METERQLDTLVDILMDLDAEDTPDTKQKFIELLKIAIDNTNIYGDVREILERMRSQYITGKKIKYGLEAANILFYIG